eukprot:3940575-Rhodomonas_salina.2
MSGTEIPRGGVWLSVLPQHRVLSAYARTRQCLVLMYHMLLPVHTRDATGRVGAPVSARD